MSNTVKYTTLNIQDVEGAAGSIKGEEWWGHNKIAKITVRLFIFMNLFPLSYIQFHH